MIYNIPDRVFREISIFAKENGITKTAIVLIGDVLTHTNYEKSRLYAADFSTEFREAKDK